MDDMRKITEDYMMELSEKVAPQVSELIGWDVSGACVQIVDSKDYWRCVGEPMCEYFDISWENLSKGASWMVCAAYMYLKWSVPMQYLPVNDSVLVYRENIGRRTNEEGFLVMLGHELVHRGQMVLHEQTSKNYVALMRRVADVFRVEGLNSNSSAAKKVARDMDLFNVLMEGDARFIHGKLIEEHYPGAHYEGWWLSRAVDSMLDCDLLRGDRDGSRSKWVRGIVERDGRDKLDELYNMELDELLQYVSRSVGHFVMIENDGWMRC